MIGYLKIDIAHGSCPTQVLLVFAFARESALGTRTFHADTVFERGAEIDRVKVECLFLKFRFLKGTDEIAVFFGMLTDDLQIIFVSVFAEVVFFSLAENRIQRS